jgi:hypothetical protein
MSDAALAQGYKILKSPLAESYGSAAEHDHEADAADELANKSTRSLNDTSHRPSLPLALTTQRRIDLTRFSGAKQPSS